MAQKQKINRSYVSDIDQFLASFDREHPEKSASQTKEITKHARIHQLRDDPHVAEEKDIWD